MRAGVVVPLTNFIGRRRELLAVRRLLSTARLVTLVGPGGCGKTRLAHELVRRAQRDDVVFLDLAPLRRAEEVSTLVAQTLGGSSHLEQLRPTVLVLDNCEHLLTPAAETVVRVLSASDHLRVLTTSREPLDVEGELVWRVPGLSLPEPASADDPSRCLRSDAVKLFVDRAQLAQPGFVLDAKTCPHVVAICRAVEGVPLAIELAAARLRHASVAELAGRLDGLLSLLVGSRRGGDPRHQALRAALDWSHALLSPEEQRLFRRAAVFAGGFRIPAAEAVYADDPRTPANTLALVASLVDKSLIVPSADGDRYRLLQPIREYALLQLREHGEEDLVAQRFARYLVALVEAELPDAMGMARGPSVSRIAEEFANIASVLPWLIHHEPARSAALLGQFAQNPWMLVRAHVALVGEWLDRTLEVHVARDAARVHGLLGRIAILLQLEVDLAKARRMADEAIAISTEIGDASVEALARRESALVAIWEDPARALDEYNRAIPLLRTHHLGGLALALSARAVLRGRQGDGAGAQRDLDEAHLTWRRYVGPSSSLRILTLVCASDVAFAAGDLSGAEARARDAVDVALNADDIGNATTGPLLILPLEFLAHLAALAGHSERAALLSGFTDRRREETGIWPRSWFKLADRTWLAEVEHRLGRRARTLRSEGRRLTVAEAISCAVGARRPSDLTAREFSVTELVARGHTDKEIAARLTISERTAESHVRRSLEKLGLRSRAELGRWAAEHAISVGGPSG